MNAHDTGGEQDGVLRRMRAASGTITPPPALDGATMAAAAVRKVRRRRVVAAVGGGVVGVLVLAAGALAVTGEPLAGMRVLPGDDRSTAVRSVPAPSATPSAEPSAAVAAEAVKAPKGWTPAQFYGLSYAMPEGWENTDPPDSWMYYGEQYWTQGGSAPGSFSLKVSDGGTIERDRMAETIRRESIDVPGAVTGELVVGFPPLPEDAPQDDLRQKVAVLTFQQSGGLWYAARFGFRAGDEVDVATLADEFADSLALTVSVQEVRADLMEYSEQLPVREVRRDTPDAWRVVETDGLRFALPPALAEDDSWDDLGPEQAEHLPDGARGWTTPNDVGDGGSRVRFFPVPSSPLIAPGSGTETFDIPGAGRVDVMVHEEPTENGSTFLGTSVDIWDQELRHGWSLTITLPATTEGRESLATFLGSLRVVS